MVTLQGNETSSAKLTAAIVGSRNIGADLMIKVMRNGRYPEMGAMAGQVSCRQRSAVPSANDLDWTRQHGMDLVIYVS
ncbi:hypothetical protein [Pandoraea terrigena]|nr:hypothetical protein [Pandoraea terrigena]